MGSSCKKSDDAVNGGGSGTEIVVNIEVGMSRFSVDRSGIFRVDKK